MQDEDQVPANRKRNKSEIALKWWDQKRVKLDSFLNITAERDRLIEEVATGRKKFFGE
jgi:hypothetical protein